MSLSYFTFGDEEPKKLTRILVYPNITYMKNLEQDSYIQVIKKIIQETNKIRDDLHWHLILPERVESLNGDNVHQSLLPFPTYPPTMRSHFNSLDILEYLSKDYDFDLIFSHLPEHTWNLVSAMKNTTHHDVPVLGYSHWFDFENIQTWPVGAFNQNMLGLLEMEKCYINTEYQKRMVLDQAKKSFNSIIVNKIKNVLDPFYLGVSKEDLSEPKDKTHKIIVFNHRTHSYKNFPHFVELMDKLWIERQDFKVWVPLIEKGQNIKRPWLDSEKLDKQEYYKKLQYCRVGFSPQQVYGGWSISTTDGLMNGTPFIMYDELYYRELNPTADFFSSDEGVLKLLNKYLDDMRYRNEKARESYEYVRENLLYENSISKISDDIDELINTRKSMGSRSERLDDIINFIKENRRVTKPDIMKFLGWGRGIKWSPYRRSLMKHPNIFEYGSLIPTYIWKIDP